MAGEHQGHHLVADLRVGEPLPRLVADSDQEAEDVLLLRIGVCRRLRDLAEDDLVQHRARARPSSPGRTGAAQQPQLEVDPVEAEGALEMLGRGGALAGLIGVEPEQRAHRDPHRKVAHPLVDVDDCAVPQLRDRRLGLDSIAATVAATCSRWKAGIMIARARSW